MRPPMAGAVKAEAAEASASAMRALVCILLGTVRFQPGIEGEETCHFS
jgi:hypothetical protein